MCSCGPPQKQSSRISARYRTRGHAHSAPILRRLAQPTTDPTSQGHTQDALATQNPPNFAILTKAASQRHTIVTEGLLLDETISKSSSPRQRRRDDDDDDDDDERRTTNDKRHHVVTNSEHRIRSSSRQSVGDEVAQPVRLPSCWHAQLLVADD